MNIHMHGTKGSKDGAFAFLEVLVRNSRLHLVEFFRKAKVYHAGVHPSGRDVDFIRGLRDTGAEIVSIEVYTHAEDIVSRTELQ